MKGERPEDQRLVAYLVTTPGSRINLTKLRESLGDVLPSHMIPATFMVVGALPVLATGKTDRLALPEPGRERPELEAEFIGPGTPVEVALAEIWSQVLDIDQIGIHDGFLELGGDSLKATRIVSRVISTFRAEVPLTALFDSPTVVEMALVVVQHRAAATSEDRIDTMLSELEAMSDEQVGLVSGGRDATPEVAS
jgi:acyl carrier protein